MENLLENSFPQNADLCFQGINLTGALLAMAAVHSGLKVVICIENPLKIDFEPELITLYPLRLKKVLASISTLKTVEKIASFYPSLIYPQRILTIYEGQKLNDKELFIIDFLLKRGRDEASLPVRFSKYKQFEQIASQINEGALIHEFRFDRNMALIYLLKKCQQLGIKIQGKFENVISKLTICCLNESNKNREVSIKMGENSFTNSFRIVNRYFETLIQKRDKKIIFYFNPIKPVSQQFFLNKAGRYMKLFGAVVSENIYKELIDIYIIVYGKNIFDGKQQLIIRDSDILSIKKNCRIIARKVSANIDIKIRFNHWLRSVEPFHFDGDHFRKMQALCDEKFDLAKQTGIEYLRFCYYYFRYSNSIDDFIEEAYEQMKYNSDKPETIWEEVEKIYQKQIEVDIYKLGKK